MNVSELIDSPADHHREQFIMVLLSSLASVQLPEHMVEAVMVELPVRTLLRLKLLSKSFKALIENPRFVTAHLLHRHRENRSIALLTKNHNIDGTRVDKMLTLTKQRRDDGQDQVCREEVELPTFASHDNEGDIFHYVDLLGSQNGLICLRLHYDHYKKNKVVLWNPATKQSRTLPPLPSSSLHRTPQICGVVDLGFVYNHATNDYMVSQIVSLVVPDDDNEPDHLCYQVDIFNVRHWGWRTCTYRRKLASNIPSGCISSLGPSNPVALRGTIYHVVSVQVPQQEETCCSFVLAMEFTNTTIGNGSNSIVFRRIEFPFEGVDCWDSSLMVVHGEGDQDESLGLFSNVDGEKVGFSCFKCNVWVLKMEGNCDGYVWSKLFTISIMHPAAIDRPMACWGDRRIVVRRTREREEEEKEQIRRRVCFNTLFIYNHNSISKGGEYMSGDLVGINDFISVNVCDYVESLVSLYPS